MNDFEFYVGGIEDGMLEMLENALKPLGVKGFYLYSGELEADNLKRAIAALAPQFPLVMVSYTDGADMRDPKISPSPSLKRPLHFRHDCSFVVICASNDARGENDRRRGKLIGMRKTGVYKMISKAREVLGGLTIKKLDSEDEEILLTHEPLIPNGVEYIAKMPDITAYAVIFDTYFRYSTLDRSVAGTEVSELVLGVESRNAPSQSNQYVPGVIFNEGEKNV